MAKFTSEFGRRSFGLTSCGSVQNFAPSDTYHFYSTTMFTSCGLTWLLELAWHGTYS